MPGFSRSPIDEIKAIRALLDDVYKDAGDGRTLFRELVQNADDAEARRLRLAVLDRGWPDAQNSLLHGPALLVANDGAFLAKDSEALHKAIGGSKEDDAAKIGTFGIGLKSVFHICEAFPYMGAEESNWEAGVLNPWAGPGEEDKDPLHPNWDDVDADSKRLMCVTWDLLGQKASKGLLLWIPLRRKRHLDRGEEGRPYGLGNRCPEPDDLCKWFVRTVPAALLLAQCGHLRAIELVRASSPDDLHARGNELMTVYRNDAEWVRRHKDDANGIPGRHFKGEIVTDDGSWSVVGIEALGNDRLCRLPSNPDWPQIPQWRNGRHSTVPRKALAHAAVTVLRPNDADAELSGTRLRWAAFLPLDDDPEPSSSMMVESKGSSPAWEIILHGYFWPSQDRRSIPGVTEAAGNTASDGDMRIRWNRTLCEDLLFPLLPSALAHAVVGIDEPTAHRLLATVVDSDMVSKRLDSVGRRHWLLPIVDVSGVRWTALEAGSRTVLSIPKWEEAPAIVRQHFVASCAQSTDDVAFIDDDAPRLAGALGDWTGDRLVRLLASIPIDEFGSAQSLRWIEGIVRHVLGADAGGGDVRAVAVVRWLVRRIGEGALAYTTRRSASRESREKLRNAWRNLCEALPKAWLIHTSVESQPAVAELAKYEVIGEGLFPVPFGYRSDESPAVELDQERLDRVLSALGRQMQAGDDLERLRHSRLLLAEALLSRRDGRPMGDLEKLPLLRTVRLPEEREEAWSVTDLRHRIEKHRVFADPVSVGLADVADPSGRPHDWKQAVAELAKAIGGAVWLVNRRAVASLAGVHVLSPTTNVLSDQVLRAKAFARPADRKPLLMRIAKSVTYGDANACQATRVLLAGRDADVVGNAVLFHDDLGSDVLHVLLRMIDRSWCAVDGKLMKSLSQEVLEALSVRRVDSQALHRLLDECLNTLDYWPQLSDEDTLLLLRHLPSTTREEKERWRRMPLHRGVDGVREAFDDRARRSTGEAGEWRLPSELENDVRLLNPDSQVQDLYEAVPTMDRDGVLRAMLEAPSPWRFANQVVKSVYSTDGRMTLPPDPELRKLLRHQCWLPHRDGGGLAPDAVLVAPEEVLHAVADLATAEAFGDKRLPDAVDLEIWQTAEPVVREILGRPSRNRQIKCLVDALNCDRVARVDGGAWLVMSDSSGIDVPLVEHALNTAFVARHPGWKMVHIVAQSLQHGNGGSKSRRVSKPLMRLAKALCAPIPPERQTQMLTLLAESRSPKDSPASYVFRRLLEDFADTDDFFALVLPELILPTQDGDWHPSRDVAMTEIGVARRHLVIPELRSILRLNGDKPVTRPSARVASKSNAMEKYFEDWRDRVPHGAVGAFLSLLGHGQQGNIKKLAQQWLGEDVAIEPIMGLESHTAGGLVVVDKHGSRVVDVAIDVAQGDYVNAVNVLGSMVKMEANYDDDTLLVGDLRYYGAQGTISYWDITLRDVAPRHRSSSDLMRLLGGTVERWACRHLGLDREHVKAWWSRWGKQSQADLGPVLESIKSNLPLTLRQLDVRQNGPLRDALRKAERARRKRQSFKVEKKALDHLSTLIEEPTHHEFLWKRVNEAIQRYGYGPDSVFLELAQNADDALAQAAEIAGGPLPVATRSLLIQVHEPDDVPTVDVTHWGRLINDTGGPTFPAGREHQWDEDLYFMMLMNLSGKPGERCGGSSSATTGHFGLGFKSVHLVSSFPSVVSGFLAFSIAGGLLPQEVVPDETESLVIEGRRPTRVRLPLRQDCEAHVLCEALFRRFGVARALLPVFARQVREVIVEGGPCPGVHVFDGEPVGGAPGWSIGAETTLPNHDGYWRILRFRPADAGQDHMGTAALAVGLREGVPTAFGPDVPFLWNVAPTSESWGCGYAVNGPVKLDPGRTHVSLDNETTLQVVRELGGALGRGLIELHDALDCQTGEARCSLTKGDYRGFLSSLWKVLATGLDNPDELRRAFLLELHGNGRGLSAWMAARPVVPSGLPAPFRPTLPPLKSDVRIEVACDGLDDMCNVLAEIKHKHLAALVDDRYVVSAKIAQIVRPLGNLSDTEGDSIGPTPFRPSDLFAELADRWNYRLTPKRLRALRPIGGDGARDFIGDDPQDTTWRGALKAKAADGSLQPLRHLLLRGDAPSPCIALDAGGKDEILRAAFAPENRVLDPAYVKHPEDWRVFRWLRVQHRVDAATMAEWYTDLREDLRQAALDYLLHGELRFDVLEHLVPIKTRPRWLRKYDDVCRLTKDQPTEPWRRQALLGALFHDHPRITERTTPAPVAIPLGPDPDTFFRRILEWWEDEAERTMVIDKYERNVWPEWLRRSDIADGLHRNSEDHWLALLVLGACRGLGRTQDQQHRNFLDLAHLKEWWDVFKVPAQPEAWMEVLESWQDGALEKLAYPQWMSLFPAIYQLSRYWMVYARMLKSAGQRPASEHLVTRLFEPLGDETLTGAGTHFEAPPAPLGMGRHWVLRELVRLEVVSGEHLFPHCWVPSEQVLKLLERFGLVRDEGLENPNKARAIFDFMARVSDTENPHLHLAFDIPLRHVARNEDLRRRFGLEQ